MKYEAKIDSRQVAITLEERDGTVAATIDNRTYEVKVVQPEQGVYLIFAGDDVYEACVWAGDRNRLQVKLRGRLFDVNIIDRRQRRSAIEHAAEGRQNLISPMPGKVVRVLLAAGNEVEAGQGVVVVEAMKMQNEIKSPKQGRVVEVRVNEGETVSANQVLAVVE
jgi:biotin carboxyl carrier protein